jgi:hypothetical protein
MTKEQIAIFTEERKWDYRGALSPSCRPDPAQMKPFVSFQRLVSLLPSLNVYP